MRISLGTAVDLLQESRRFGWKYQFGKQVGTLVDGDINTIYYRHVILGVPPADIRRPLPGYANHLWVDACILMSMFPVLAWENQLTMICKRPFSLLGMSKEDACKLIGASAEFKNHEPDLRKQMLKAVGLLEIQITDRELPTLNPNWKPSTDSSSSSALRLKLIKKVRKK